MWTGTWTPRQPVPNFIVQPIPQRTVVFRFCDGWCQALWCRGLAGCRGWQQCRTADRADQCDGRWRECTRRERPGNGALQPCRRTNWNSASSTQRQLAQRTESLTAGEIFGAACAPSKTTAAVRRTTAAVAKDGGGHRHAGGRHRALGFINILAVIVPSHFRWSWACLSLVFRSFLLFFSLDACLSRSLSRALALFLSRSLAALALGPVSRSLASLSLARSRSLAPWGLGPRSAISWAAAGLADPQTHRMIEP